MRIRHLTNQKGMALAMVLMIMMVLSILGMALASLSLSENKISIYQQRKLQAHYVAKSGLESVAKNLISNPSQLKSALTAGTTYSGTIGGGNYEVTLSGSMDTAVLMRATGQHGTAQDSISLDVNTVARPGDLFDNAVYSKNDLNVSGMNVTGPLQSGGTVTPPPNYAYPVKDNCAMNLTTPEFPTITNTVTSTVTINNSNTHVVSSNTEYGDIHVRNGGTLELRTTTGNILEVIVNNLEVDGRVIVTGGGHAILYIRTYVTMTTSGSFNYGSGANPDKLTMILGDNSLFYIQGGMGFGGYVMGPNATVYVNSGNIYLEGAIICEEFRQNNNATMTYIPPAGGAGPNYNGIIYNVYKVLYKE